MKCKKQREKKRSGLGLSSSVMVHLVKQTKRFLPTSRVSALQLKSSNMFTRDKQLTHLPLGLMIYGTLTHPFHTNFNILPVAASSTGNQLQRTLKTKDVKVNQILFWFEEA